MVTTKANSFLIKILTFSSQPNEATGRDVKVKRMAIEDKRRLTFGLGGTDAVRK